MKQQYTQLKDKEKGEEKSEEKSKEKQQESKNIEKQSVTETPKKEEKLSNKIHVGTKDEVHELVCYFIFFLLDLFEQWSGDKLISFETWPKIDYYWQTLDNDKWHYVTAPTSTVGEILETIAIQLQINTNTLSMFEAVNDTTPCKTFFFFLKY
jgi:hypothetical protein